MNKPLIDFVPNYLCLNFKFIEEKNVTIIFPVNLTIIIMSSQGACKDLASLVYTGKQNSDFFSGLFLYDVLAYVFN